MSFYGDLVNMSVFVMRDNATTSNKYTACSINLWVILVICRSGNMLIIIAMRSSRVHSRRSFHLQLRSGRWLMLRSRHKSQLEAHEAFTSKTDLKWVPE